MLNTRKELKSHFVIKELLLNFECISSNKVTLTLHINNEFWMIKSYAKTNY